jgi:3-dehydro-L-gulonate 2-dehydrogenase
MAGSLIPGNKAELDHANGNIEQWDGNLGPGPINAILCSSRAMEIASKNGLGCVALRNTNHWMRAGWYGWQAAKKGFVLIAWTNTTGIMPPWGTHEPKIGNNPMVIGIPYNNRAIVLDMAMTQFSYGTMELYEMRNEMLGAPGGYDENGKITLDPSAILKTRRPLPIGYWKGSGLALLLDILAFTLSGGLPTVEVSKQVNESGVCQIYLAIDLKKLKNHSTMNDTINHVIEDLKKSIPIDKDKPVRYPGERVEWIRKENSEKGIPVLKKVWEEIQKL